MKKVLTYFAYFGDENEKENILNIRKDLINNQLEYINSLEKDSSFDEKYIVATIPSHYNTYLNQIADKYEYTIFKNYISRTNTFEYPGFLFMSNLASKLNKNDAIFYFHSKGASTVNNKEKSIDIFQMHVKAIMNICVEDIFSNPNITRIGLFPAQHGWLWHNFFVAKSLMLNRPVPLDSNRFLYESFIGNFNNPNEYKSVQSLIPILYPKTTFNIKPFYEPKDVGIELIKVLF